MLSVLAAAQGCPVALQQQYGSRPAVSESSLHLASACAMGMPEQSADPLLWSPDMHMQHISIVFSPICSANQSQECASSGSIQSDNWIPLPSDHTSMIDNPLARGVTMEFDRGLQRGSIVVPDHQAGGECCREVHNATIPQQAGPTCGDGDMSSFADMVNNTNNSLVALEAILDLTGLVASAILHRWGDSDLTCVIKPWCMHATAHSYTTCKVQCALNLAPTTKRCR